ncbi:hypothetical protein ABH933_001212 [Nocardia sp. GP40]|uniref:hypothetical protein n=1 Tax=Nocardia sp. GP40 TaxID=3156268 RepID=UPI003D1EFAE2
MQPHSNNPTSDSPDLRLVPGADLNQVIAAAMPAEHLDTRTLILANPENHFIAGLLNASTAEAAEILALVKDTDLQGHLPGIILQLIRQLVTSGQEPTPQAVIARARIPVETQIGTKDIRPPLPSVVQYVSTAYTMGMPVRLWADASRVVEDSYRRGFEAIGTRMAQMAAAVADVEDLELLTGQAIRQWRADWHRVHLLRNLANGEPVTPEPPASGTPPVDELPASE